MNKYNQLVDDLVEGKLNQTLVGSAIKEYICRRKDIPEAIKNLLCSKEENGLIGATFELMRQIIGSMDLAYRRNNSKTV